MKESKELIAEIQRLRNALTIIAQSPIWIDGSRTKEYNWHTYAATSVSVASKALKECVDLNSHPESEEESW